MLLGNCSRYPIHPTRPTHQIHPSISMHSQERFPLLSKAIELNQETLNLYREQFPTGFSYQPSASTAKTDKWDVMEKKENGNQN